MASVQKQGGAEAGEGTGKQATVRTVLDVHGSYWWHFSAVVSYDGN